MMEPCGVRAEAGFTDPAALRERSFGQAAVDSLPGVFYLFTREGRFLRWNRNLEVASGYSSAELARMGPLELISEADRPVTRAAIDATFFTGNASVECDFLAKDGTTTPYFFTGKLVDFEGTPCLVGMGVDVSERRRAEAGVRERDQLLRRIIEECPLSMAIVGLDGTIEYINRRAVETFGYLHTDIPDMDHWWRVAYPDEGYRAAVIARWMGLVQYAMTHGTEIERAEYRVTCKDGTVKTMVIFGHLVTGKVFVMFEDITARQRAQEDALREREHNFSALADNASDAILIVAASGDHRYANRRAAEITGHSVAGAARAQRASARRTPTSPAGCPGRAHRSRCTSRVALRSRAASSPDAGSRRRWRSRRQ